MEEVDVVIVGAGPAGLVAATYLTRFGRCVLVLDGGPSRAASIPKSHNTPGFPHGVTGVELLRRLREQALEFGAEIRDEAGKRLTTGDADGVTVELAAGGKVRASFGLLAAGMRDKRPPQASLDEAIRRGLVRLCPICDGYEARGARIAVLGEGRHALREARFLTTFSNKVTLLHSGPAPLPADLRGPAERDGVYILCNVRPEEIRIGANSVAAHDRVFDFLYLALGCDEPEIVRALPLARDDHGALLVSAHQQTSLPRLYAAGDLVRGLSQIAVAAGEAAVAATDIHQRMRAERGAETRAE